MEKRKYTIYEVLHEAVLDCFEWVAYMDNALPSDSPEALWDLENDTDEFKEFLRQHIDPETYRKAHTLHPDTFGCEFQPHFLDNADYLKLSLFGNQVEYFFFSHLTPAQAANHFNDSAMVLYARRS